MMIQQLKEAIAAVREVEEEKTAVTEMEARANAEITALGASDKFNGEKAQAKITVASNTLTVCKSRRKKLEVCGKTLLDELDGILGEALSLWNLALNRRIQILRADFLTANLRFFENNEAATADRLEGILPAPVHPLTRARRNRWSHNYTDSMFRPPFISEKVWAEKGDNVRIAWLLEEGSQLIVWMQQKSKELDIPIE